MPSTYEFYDIGGEHGYCWHCHEWTESAIIKVWEGVGRDEEDEYEDGHCPQCGEMIDTESMCFLCDDRDNLIEFEIDGHVRLVCPSCANDIIMPHDE